MEGERLRQREQVLTADEDRLTGPSSGNASRRMSNRRIEDVGEPIARVRVDDRVHQVQRMERWDTRCQVVTLSSGQVGFLAAPDHPTFDAEPARRNRLDHSAL